MANLKIEVYLKKELAKLPTEKALKAIYCEYGAQNLLTEEFYSELVERIIKPMQ